MGRGRAADSDVLVETAAAILRRIKPCSVRAVCYQLFVGGVIPSMAKKETSRVSRNLVWARENDLRDRLEAEVAALIEPNAWARTGLAEEAEQESLRLVMTKWSGNSGQGAECDS